MAELERIVARIEGDLTGLRAELGKASQLSDKAAREMTSHFSKVNRAVDAVDRSMAALGVSLGRVAGAGAAGAAIAAISNLQKRAIELGSTIADQALQTGLSTTAIQELTYAGLQLGLTEEQLSGALRRLSINIGQVRTEGDNAVPVFGRLGVALTDVNGAARSNEAVFRDAIERLRSIQDPATRAAEAFELFGKEAGPKFAELIAEGAAGLDRHAEAARAAGAVLEKDFIDKMKQAGDQIAALDKQISVNLAQAFGSTQPFALLWKDTLVGITGALAQMRRDSDAARDSMALFGEQMRVADAATGAVFSEAAHAGEDYLAVLERIRTMTEGMPVPFVDQQPFAGAIPLRPGAGAAGNAKPAAGEAERLVEVDRLVAEQQMVINRELGVAKQEQWSQDVDAFLDSKSLELQIASDTAEAQKKLDREVLDQKLANLSTLFEGQRQYAQAFVDFQSGADDQRLQSGMKLAEGLLQSASRTSKKAFETSKKYAIAQAAISSAQAAIGAAADTNGPWYVRLVAAGAALAYGYAQIRAIKATQYGGAGGGAVSAGSPATAPGDVGGGGFGGGNGGPSSRTIVLQGINPNDLFTGRQILDLINQATADGGRINVVTGGG